MSQSPDICQQVLMQKEKLGETPGCLWEQVDIE